LVGFWSAPAERSGDGAFADFDFRSAEDPKRREHGALPALLLILIFDLQTIQSAVGAALCRRTPKLFTALLE